MRNIIMLLLLSVLLCATSACQKKAPAPDPGPNLNMDHVSIRVLNNVDAALQRQGYWQRIDLELKNISKHTLILRRAYTDGMWDRNKHFFKSVIGQMRHDQDKNIFIWYDRSKVLSNYPLITGLLLPGESMQVSIYPRLMISPSVTRKIHVNYYILPTANDLHTKVYFPTSSDIGKAFRPIPADSIGEIKNTDTAKRIALLPSTMGLPERTVHNSISFNPTPASESLKSCQNSLGIETLKEQNYIFSIMLQSWIFQTGKDTRIVTEDADTLIRRCDIRVFNFADLNKDEISFRARNIERFIALTTIEDMNFKDYAQNYPATMPKRYFERLLTESKNLGWGLSLKKDKLDNQHLFIDN